MNKITIQFPEDEVKVIEGFVREEELHKLSGEELTEAIGRVYDKVMNSHVAPNRQAIYVVDSLEYLRKTSPKGSPTMVNPELAGHMFKEFKRQFVPAFLKCANEVASRLLSEESEPLQETRPPSPQPPLQEDPLVE